VFSPTLLIDLCVLESFGLLDINNILVVLENMEFGFFTSFSLHYSEIGCFRKIGKFVSFLHFISKKSKKLFIFSK